MNEFQRESILFFARHATLDQWAFYLFLQTAFLAPLIGLGRLLLPVAQTKRD